MPKTIVETSPREYINDSLIHIIMSFGKYHFYDRYACILFISEETGNDRNDVNLSSKVLRRVLSSISESCIEQLTYTIRFNRLASTRDSLSDTSLLSTPADKYKNNRYT